MKKLLLLSIVLFNATIALSQTIPLTVSFRGNTPVNSKDTIAYTYPGKIGGYSWLYNAEYIRTNFANQFIKKGNRYILATGQSNANGVNNDSGNTEIDTTSNPKVLGWNGSAWVVAKIGVSPFSCATPFTLRTTLLKSIGAPYFFAKKLQQQTGDTIRVYMLAWGGESINNWTGTTSKNWHFIDSVITSTIGSKKIDVMTWQQGEIDSAVLATYPAKFDSVYNQLHSATWARKTTPIIIGAATPRFQSVNLTQRYISHSDSLNIYYASMADISGGIWQYDTTHWSARAQSELGGRFLSAYNNFFKYKFYDLFSSDIDGNISTAYPVSAPSVKIIGVNGKGVIQLARQSTITAPPANTLWLFATNAGNLAWRNPGNFQTSIVSAAITASRSYTLPDTTGKFVLESNIATILNKDLSSLTNTFPTALADGSTKGIASFNANDFDASGGNISIDYTNGQAADATHKGFLPAADWNTFNNKQPAGSYLTGNETITLSGDVSGSGATAITTTIGASKVTNTMLAGSIDLTTKVTGLLPDANISSASTWNAKQSAITFGTGVQTALGVNIGSAGAPILFNGALGAPSSGDITNTNFNTLGDARYGQLATPNQWTAVNKYTFGIGINSNAPIAFNVNASHFTNFQAAAVNSATRTITLPDTSGTVALTSNITDSLDATIRFPKVVKTGNISASATATILTYTTPNTGTVSMFNVNGSVNITAISGGDVLQFRVNYQDASNTARTLNFGGGLTTVSDNARNTSSITCYPNTTITIETALTTATGAITYTAQAALVKLVTF